jgi:hypothetical protein
VARVLDAEYGSTRVQVLIVTCTEPMAAASISEELGRAKGLVERMADEPFAKELVHLRVDAPFGEDTKIDGIKTRVKPRRRRAREPTAGF